MDKKSIKKLCWVVATSSLVTLIAGCAPDKVTPKPWDVSVFSQTSFSFNDNDPAEKIISGDIKIGGIPKLDNVESYLIYWADSSSKSGKGSLLKEISGTPSSGTLYTVPKGTAMSGEYFQLFLKMTDSGEQFSGKSLAINDLLVAAKVERKGVKTPETVETKVGPVAIGKTEVVEQKIEQPKQPEAIAAPTSAVAAIETPEAPATAATTTDDAVEKGPQVKVEIPILIVKNVLFEFDKYNILEEHKQQLLQRLDNLENKDQAKFLIAGHADERGSNAYNLALGERRAYVVKRFLVSMGFLEENMKIISYGEEKPVEMGHDEASWAKNRRAETLDVRNEQ